MLRKVVEPVVNLRQEVGAVWCVLYGVCCMVGAVWCLWQEVGAVWCVLYGVCGNYNRARTALHADSTLCDQCMQHAEGAP
jgi:hypothetical protein